jgi:prepilin-type N-terminal cleavage/methylation domain-containing protein
VKTKLKGFTLIELIVVMAIFGAIMFAAMGLMSPVGKQFSSTSQYENARSSIDNVSRYISGTLRYADRCMICAGSIYNIDYDDSTGNAPTDVQSKVAKFGEYYFKDNYQIDKEHVYVLTFNNATGDIYKYDFENTAGNYTFTQVANTKGYNPINDALFDDYQFKYYIGSWDYMQDDSGDYTLQKQSNDGSGTNTIISANNMAFTIDVFKKYTDSSGNITTKALQQCSVTSFSLINTALYPLRPDLDDDGVQKTTDNGEKMWKEDSDVSGFYAPIINDGDTTIPLNADDNFFIIYTLPQKY